MLTVNPRAYPSVATDMLGDIPKGINVYPAFCLDAARHMSIAGRYLDWTALPDRWVSWICGGVATGMRAIRKEKPQLIWSTYPIATGLWVGYLLHRITALPWIVDLRDPLTEVDQRTGNWHPADKRLLSARRAIERRAVEHSSRTVLVTPGSKQIHVERYPHLPDKHWAVIPNGYEEEVFAAVEKQQHSMPRQGGPVRLLHSGVLYPTPDRNPIDFFKALAFMKEAGEICENSLTVTLRASGSTEHYGRLIREYGLEGMVHLEPAIPYRDALWEMLCADGLLVFQGYTSNPAVPAKLYEYLRARRPIFAMVDSQGDTAATLRAARAGEIVPLESSSEIAEGLRRFLRQIQEGTAPSAEMSIVRTFAREARAAELATLFDQVVSE